MVMVMIIVFYMKLWEMKKNWLLTNGSAVQVRAGEPTQNKAIPIINFIGIFYFQEFNMVIE